MRVSWLHTSLLVSAISGCAVNQTQGVAAQISVTCSPPETPEPPQCKTIDFGVVPVGQTAEQQLTATNWGRSALIPKSISFDSPTAPFRVLNDISTLKPAGNATVGLSFTPLAPGPVSAVLTIASNAQNEPSVQITVTGEGIGPAQASLMPTTIDFGNVLVGSTASKPATLTNNDSAPIEVLSESTTGDPVFGATPTTGTVAPGMSLPLTVTFQPTTTGTFGGEASWLVRRSDTPTAPPTTLTLPLAGHSLPVIQVTPLALTFTNDTLGSMGQQSFVISNTGEAPLLLQSVAFTGGTSATFSMPAGTPVTASIAPMGMETITVTYAPILTTSTTADTGSVTISSSDPQNPTVVVTLNGQCTNCNPPPPNTCATERPCNCGPQTACLAGGACVAARRVFVSAAMTTGNVGGLAGADALCNQYATAAQLGGTWMAFLADDQGAPAARFMLASVPYAMLDGTVIASNGMGLLGYSLEHEIDLDECAQMRATAEVWTGIDDPGETVGESVCSDFTSSDVNAIYSPVGLTNHADSGWFQQYLQFCNRTNVRLYCVEQ
jgi:hypothetical protein